MDVNETLRALRDALQDWHRFDDPMDALNAADKVIESFESLDAWLSKGGFLPNEWNWALRNDVQSRKAVTHG